MLKIVMDSAGDLPAGWADEYAIDIIPINIHFGERTYLQGVDLGNRDFYRLADESGVIPKTSQPSPQQFIDFYLRPEAQLGWAREYFVSVFNRKADVPDDLRARIADKVVLFDAVQVSRGWAAWVDRWMREVRG